MERKPYSLAYSPFTRSTALFWAIVVVVTVIVAWVIYESGSWRSIDWSVVILSVVLAYVINIRSDVENIKAMLKKKE